MVDIEGIILDALFTEQGLNPKISSQRILFEAGSRKTLVSPQTKSNWELRVTAHQYKNPKSYASIGLCFGNQDRWWIQERWRKAKFCNCSDPMVQEKVPQHHLVLVLLTEMTMAGAGCGQLGIWTLRTNSAAIGHKGTVDWTVHPPQGGNGKGQCVMAVLVPVPSVFTVLL